MKVYRYQENAIRQAKKMSLSNHKFLTYVYNCNGFFIASLGDLGYGNLVNIIQGKRILL